MLFKKDLDILQEVLNEEILSYLDSGYELQLWNRSMWWIWENKLKKGDAIWKKNH